MISCGIMASSPCNGRRWRWGRWLCALLGFPFLYILRRTETQCKNRKIFTGPTYKSHLSYMIIWYVYRCSISNQTTLTRSCLTQWIWKFPGAFEIHCVRQYLVNVTGLADKIKATVYKTSQFFTGLEHAKVSAYLTLEKLNLIYIYIYFHFIRVHGHHIEICLSGCPRVQ